MVDISNSSFSQMSDLRIGLLKNSTEIVSLPFEKSVFAVEPLKNIMVFNIKEFTRKLYF